MANVLYERLGAASLLTIDRPERRNAIDGQTAEELLAGYRSFERGRTRLCWSSPAAARRRSARELI